MNADAISEIGSHEIEPYRPDGGISLVGLVMALIGSLLAAVAVGYVASLIGQFFYLVLLFPIGMGAMVGVACLLLVQAGHLRNVVVAFLLGLVSGTVSVVALHYFDYLRTIQAIEKTEPGFRKEVVDQGGFTLLDYMHLAATQGITIGKFGDKNPLNLGYIGSIIYWLVELAMVVGFAAYLAMDAARTPYCRSCSCWKEEKVVANLEGYDAAETTDMVKRGELGKVLEKAVAPRADGLQLKLASCPKCGEEATAVVTVAESVPNAKGEMKTTELVRLVYPGRIRRGLAVDPISPTPEQNQA